MSSDISLRIATRGSPLALAQTQKTMELLSVAHPDLNLELVPITTEGDLRADVPIAEMGGKAVFSSALEKALLSGQADLAVHSAKDLSAVLPEGLAIGAVPVRGNPRDVLVGADSIESLQPGAKVATGAPRRQVQLSALRPDLEIRDLRGNIHTRLEKLADFSAIVLSAAALNRLDMNPQPSQILETDIMLPQVGQGAIAVEYVAARQDELGQFLNSIDDWQSHSVLSAERGFLKELGGDCNLPAAAYAEIRRDEMHISGLLSPQPGSIQKASLSAPMDDAALDIGKRLAQILANSK